MKIHLALIAPLFITIALGAHADVSGYRIATPGSHHGKEVFARDGEKWWGLFQTAENGWELLPVTLTVTIEFDAIGDDDPKKPTGRNVLTERERQPYLLIDGLKNPIAGRMVGKGDLHRFVVPEESLAVELPGVLPVRLVALGKPRERPSQGICFFPYELTLCGASDTSDEARQYLISRDGAGGDFSPTVNWMGDIDRDGKLDLLLDLTDHYNVSHLALYLSSERKLGDLVRLVARYRTTGC